MPPLTPSNVLVDGHRIACGRHGAGDPVVLIHGTPSFSHAWRNVVPGLVAAGHEVFVFDLLGYGRSERPFEPRADTSVAGQVPVLLGLLDHWGIGRADVVGTDIGGAIAMRFGIFHPERARSLTLIDTVSFDSWPSERTRAQLAEGLEPMLRASDAAHRTHFAEWLRSAVRDVGRFETEALDDYLRMISGPIGQASLFQHQVSHYDGRYTAELDDRLHELGRMPVQILWGEDDAWQKPEWGERLHRAIPGAELHRIPRCGHFAMEDRPEIVTERIVAFLDRA